MAINRNFTAEEILDLMHWMEKIQQFILDHEDIPKSESSNPDEQLLAFKSELIKGQINELADSQTPLDEIPKEYHLLVKLHRQTREMYDFLTGDLEAKAKFCVKYMADHPNLRRKSASLFERKIIDFVDRIKKAMRGGFADKPGYQAHMAKAAKAAGARSQP